MNTIIFLLIAVVFFFAAIVIIRRVRRSEETLRESERYTRNLFNSSPIGLALCRMDGSLIDVNSAFAGIIGRTVEETLRLSYWDITPEKYVEQEQAQLELLRTTGRYGPYEKEYIHKDGHLVPVHLQGLIIERAGEKFIWSSAEDVTDRKRAELLLSSEKQVLEMISTGAGLPEVLNEIVLAIESLSHETIASILLLDAAGIHVHYGAAPNLPDAYNRAIEGAEIGPRAGSCGTAAYRKEPVIVTDIETDPLWTDYRDLARAFGLRACWSTPIMSPEGQVLGTFAMYYREPRSPAAADYELIERATHLAQIAIMSKRALELLRQSEERLRLVMDGLGPQMFVGLMDTEGVVLVANRPALEAAGLSLEDVVGRPVQDTYWWSYSDSVRQRLREAVRRAAQGEAVRYDEEIRVAEDRFIWLDFSVQPLRDNSGIIAFLVPSAVVITERKKAEEELRITNEELERRVSERTRELEEKNAELAKFNKLFVERELRMIELKEKMKTLERSDRRAGDAT